MKLRGESSKSGGMFGGGATSSSYFFGSSSSSFSLLPQTLMEGAFALVLVAVLAVPLINKIHRLLEEASRDTPSDKNTRDFSNLQNHPTEILYPNPLDDDCASTCTQFDFTTLDDDGLGDVRRRKTPYKRADNFAFEESNDEAGATDMPFDYRAYRHKLMEEVLQKCYSQGQAPGQVVMNSIQLNAMDDSNFKGGKVNFFDFAGNLYRHPQPVEKPKEDGYVHPLDHFLVKGRTKAVTEEKAIETTSPSVWSVTDTGSETMLHSPKNEVEVPVSPKSPHRHRTGCETEERPRTTGSRLPTAIKCTNISSQAIHRQSNSANPPADVFRVERDHHHASRPQTAVDYTSDDGSLTVESSRESKRPRRRKEETTTVKKPWITSSHVTSYNRKYANRDLDRNSVFETKWRNRSKSRTRSPSRTVEPPSVTEDSMTSVASSRRPSPARSAVAAVLQKKSEVVQKVTTFSSSAVHDERNLEKGCGGKSREEDASAKQKPSILSNPSSSSKSRGSRLPLHVNSKKPIGSKQRDNELECSEAEKCQRPKTSSGSFVRQCANRYDSRDFEEVYDPAGSKDDVSRTTESEDRKPWLGPSQPETFTRKTANRVVDRSPEGSPATSRSESPSPQRRSTKPSDNLGEDVSYERSDLGDENETDNTCRENFREVEQESVTKRPKTSSGAAKRSQDLGSRPRREDGGGSNTRLATPRISSRKRKMQEDIRHEEEEESTPCRASTPKPSSRVKVAMNEGLKAYIEKLKIVLMEQHDGRDEILVEQARLSLSEAVIADLETKLTAREIRELREILRAVEKRISDESEQAFQKH